MGICRVALLLLAVSAASTADESCHSFAGGSVYPAGTGRNLEHSLQFTKAVSLYSAHTLLALDLILIFFAQFPSRRRTGKAQPLLAAKLRKSDCPTTVENTLFSSSIRLTCKCPRGVNCLLGAESGILKIIHDIF